MDKQELIKIEKEKYNRSFIIISSLPENLDVRFISGENVFLENSLTFKDFLSELDKFNIADIEIDSYYISSDRLAIKYLYKSFNIVFFCCEIEKAIDELSGGTCEILYETSTSTEGIVSCKLS